jgi:peroxiredoxin
VLDGHHRLMSRMQARLVTAAVTLALVMLSLSGCSRGDADDVPDQGFISGDSTITTMPVGQRDTPVRFDGTTLSGEPFDVREHRGKVVVVNVWGSWCPPCIAEARDLQEVWAGSADLEVQFIGIDTQDNRSAALAHEKRFGVTYPSIDDDGGRVLLALRGSLPPKAIPSTLVLDRRGRVAARVLGQVPPSTLRALISDALAETARA